jgi:hypothetical protein
MIRLIDVARYTEGYSKGLDLDGLTEFIANDDYFRGRSNDEWLSLDMLLCSTLVRRQVLLQLFSIKQY